MYSKRSRVREPDAEPDASSQTQKTGWLPNVDCLACLGQDAIPTAHSNWGRAGVELGFIELGSNGLGQDAIPIHCLFLYKTESPDRKVAQRRSKRPARVRFGAWQGPPYAAACGREN